MFLFMKTKFETGKISDKINLNQAGLKLWLAIACGAA